MLWKITAPNGNVSFMMGTNHSYGGTFIDTLPKVMAAIHAAEYVVLESLPDQQQNEMPSFTGKTPFSKLFSPADYRMMDSVLAAYGMDPLHELDSVHFPPHLLAAHLVGRLMGEKDDRMKAEDESVDSHVLHLAQQHHTSLIGLDSGFTVREGILQFGLTEQEWADNITKLFREKISGNERTELDEGSYGALQHDYQFNIHPPFGPGSDHHHLLVERNAHWMKSLPKILREKRSFVAVGISHLSYKNGLLMELKKQGFKVEPVNVVPKEKFKPDLQVTKQ
ncbi:TraB/GumN family protein [Chitinophaga sp. GCM10012297]|uniref:TraB/GumN family protein n=1 Tax=Chitinophaga chungangae TaxID=2821488 RepID=A0ABS3YIK3_9BACT|nr:TraB/GumN family protein [Chitinophaga chungangae]MBO9154516.1 TraB/GumN family protein [Chitinophaga chungangae]